eukprot:4149558-Pyramimonas_sp.AAC.1
MLGAPSLAPTLERRGAASVPGRARRGQTWPRQKAPFHEGHRAPAGAAPGPSSISRLPSQGLAWASHMRQLLRGGRSHGRRCDNTSAGCSAVAQPAALVPGLALRVALRTGETAVICHNARNHDLAHMSCGGSSLPR